MERANLYFQGTLAIGHQGILPEYSNILVLSFKPHH